MKGISFFLLVIFIGTTILAQQNIKAPEMVFVKGGTFQIGSKDSDAYNNEQPIHLVTVNDFFIGKYEVTNEQFCDFLNDYGSYQVKSGTYTGYNIIYTDSMGIQKIGNKWIPANGYAKNPVISVTWYGANEYCKWLSRKTGHTYRLPTEAEWEYAAGGGQNSPLSKGAGGIINLQKWSGTCNENNLGNYAWYWDNSGGGTHPVGTKLPNELGIYDMSGNVWEWCNDWYGEYSSYSQTNPQGPSSGSNRVIRGASWNNDAYCCRVAYRDYMDPCLVNDNLGFRVVREK